MGLIVIGLTGSLLVFGPELEALLAPERMDVRPASRGRLGFDALQAAVGKTLAAGNHLTGWYIPPNPRLADTASVAVPGDPKVYLLKVDPYTGRTLGDKRQVEQTLTGWLLNLHYTFLAGTAGTLVAGLLATGLCLLGLTGLWLYRNFWKNFLTLRWGRSARIFFSDLHKMVGISSVAFHLVLGFTGAYWNLPAVYRALSARSVSVPPPQTAAPAVPETAGLPIGRYLQQAGEKLPGFRPSYLALPPAGGTLLTVYGSVPPLNPLRSAYGSTATFDVLKGDLTSVKDIRQASWWAQVEDAFVPVHFGTFGGWPVKVLWCIGGLSPGVLTLSGFLIWQTRRRGRRQRPAPAIIPTAATACVAEDAVCRPADGKGVGRGVV